LIYSLHTLLVEKEVLHFSGLVPDAQNPTNGQITSTADQPSLENFELKDNSEGYLRLGQGRAGTDIFRRKLDDAVLRRLLLYSFDQVFVTGLRC
jgi:hypothetical protein